MDSTYIWIVVTSDCDEFFIKQMLVKANELSSQGNYKICLIYLSDSENADLSSYYQYGADDVVLIKGYNNRLQLPETIFIKVGANFPPALIMCPSSYLGQYIAAEISLCFDAGYIADCIDIKISETGEFRFYRAAINESVIATILCQNTGIGVCTIKKNVFKHSVTKQKPVVKQYQYQIASAAETRFINLAGRNVDVGNKNIEQAKIIFGIGRGAADAKTLEIVRILSRKVGAVIGGTRNIIEDGVLDKPYQIGQSGIQVQPDLYIALGISGAIQHVVGMQNAKTIIAVNKDPNALIFKYSDIAIVSECEPVLTKILQKLKGE